MDSPQTLLILGGYGNTGRLLVELLLHETQAHLVIAGRNAEKAQTLAAELNRSLPMPRLRGIAMDASQTESMLDAFRGIDMVVVASSTTRYASQVAQAALQAGADYLDIQYSPQKFAVLQALSSQIEVSGRCFITDGGFHPGLPAALVRFGAGFFDRLEVANVGSVIKIDWASLDLPDATVLELVEMLSDFSMLVYKGGRWMKASMLSTRDYLKMDFGVRAGNPFGVQMVAPMFLEEMRSLPEQYPELRETGFYVGSFNWFVDWLVMPLGMLGLRIAPQRSLRLTTRLMRWGLVMFSKPPYGTLLKLEAAGLKDTQPHQLTVMLYHPDGYMFTAIPIAACLLQYLDGSIRKPGLWTQANLVEPARLMADMQRMGVEIDIKEKP